MIGVATVGNDAEGWCWRLVDTSTGAIVEEGKVPRLKEEWAHAAGARQLGALQQQERRD